jgi:MoaA/NifB/PqqE/SkfB family radical SAM enzyme
MSIKNLTGVNLAVEIGSRLKQFAGVAAGGLGWTRGRAPVGPLHAQIGICDPCNHRCVMCWDHPPEDRASEATAERFGFQPQELMSLETFQSIVDDLHALGTRRLDFVGRGEPLLNPSAMDMVNYAKKKGMLVLLCTNASKLSAECSESLVAAGLDRLNVSLNAGTPETYPEIHVTESPENYRRVKKNLTYLAERRRAAKAQKPHIRLSFVIGSKNYFEIEEMVRVVSEVGADEAMFTHTVVHEGTPDLALNREQYEDLLALCDRARKTGRVHGVQTNLTTFSATTPPYLESKMGSEAVVPCYVGWYFANVLANGSVMPCCQCAVPVDRVGNGTRFADIWASDQYTEFRNAARSLPVKNDKLATCECDNCLLRPRNITIHNILHPLNRIKGGDDDQLYTIRDLVRMKKVDRT